MRFRHAPEIWSSFPELVAGVLRVGALDAGADTAAAMARLSAQAMARLAAGAESDLAAIQAWRRAFSRMGLKPTQYRCASEALLRRLRQEGALPRLHPLVDLCNALSAAFAIPVAAFDVARIGGDLEVRLAAGTERYLTFGGEIETPAPGEVIFADADGHAHARRWTNRQSGLSAVRETTREVLIVAEALHQGARPEVEALLAVAGEEIARAWGVGGTSAILSVEAPTFG